MSFEQVCSGCGAASGPSVGVCPFCKTIMVSSNDGNYQQEKSVTQLYEKGRLDLALLLAKKLYSEDAESKKDVSFLMLFAKILIESEGPSSLIRSALADAHLLDPSNPNILDYLELMEIKRYLDKGPNDPGEVQLKNLIRRSPGNVHAHFMLGTHFYWTDDEPLMAIPHLETCVRLSPGFLRAWGCLGAIYKKLGNSQLAMRAFQKCAELETESRMKNYFLEQAKAAE